MDQNICGQCGMSFLVTSQYWRTRRKYCSYPCAVAASRGRTLPPRPSTPWDEIVRRFWAKLRPGAPDDCWLWQGARYAPNGYGKLVQRNPSKEHRAHRLSYEIHNGAIPAGLEICHHCDNPPCCNPAHLFLGTHADNMHDMIVKGRRTCAHGKQHPRAKLRDDDVRVIRLLNASGISQTALGAQYGIPQSAVSSIIRGKTWKHVV